MPPFQPFLEALRAEGLGVGIDDHVAIQRLLALEGEWSADELRLAFRATLARTEDEQQRFDRVAASWFVAPVASAALDPVPQSQSDGESSPLWWAVPGVAVLLVLAFGAFWWADPVVDPARPTPDAPPIEQPVVDPGVGTLSIEGLPDAPEVGISPVARAEQIRVAPLSIVPEPAPVPGRPWFLLGFALLAAVATLVAVSVVAVRRRRVQRTERVGPYTFRLSLEADDARPLSLQEVDDLGAALTWSRDGQEVRRLDVSRTVARTVRAAGRFQAVWQSAPPSPRYAVLLDLDRGPAPVSREIDGIFRQLAASGLQVDRFHFRGEPEFLAHARTDERIRLDALASRGFHVLVVVGDPECAVDPDTGGPRTWVEWLQRVPDRAWLAAPHHTRPGIGTTHLERAGVPVLPAQLEALAACRPDQPAELEAVPTWAPIVELEPGSRAAREELERVLGEGYAVLCAATALPRFDGPSLGWLLERLGGQITARSRLALLGLPWVEAGLPESLTDSLRADLRDRFPTLGAQVRQWTAEALEAVAPPEGSGAHLSWRLQRAELSDDLEAKHAIYRELARDSSLGLSLVEERLRGLEQTASTQARTLRRAVIDALESARGTRWTRAALGSAVAASVLLAVFVAAGRPAYEPVQAVYSGPESRFELTVESCDGARCDRGLLVHLPDDAVLPAADDWEIRTRAHSIGRDVSRTDVWVPTQLEPVTTEAGPRTTVILPMFNHPIQNDFESGVSVAASVELGNGTSEQGDDDRVTATVRRYAGQMTYCYERQLNENPALQGRVEVGWSVDGGVVQSAYVVSNDTGDDRLAKCMVDKLRRWKFDADIAGDMSWPFVFRPRRTGVGAATRALASDAMASTWFEDPASNVVVWPWGPGERTVFVDGPDQLQASLFEPADPDAPPLGRYAAVRAGLETVEALADRPVDVVVLSGGFDAESLDETCGDHIERASALESRIRRLTEANPLIRVHTFGFGTPIGIEGRSPGRASIDATEQRGWCGVERPSFRELEASNAVPAADLRGFAAAGRGLSGFGTTGESLSAFLQAVAAPRAAGWVLPEGAERPSTEVVEDWDVTEVSLRSASLDVEVTACVSDTYACPPFDTGYADLAVLVAAIGDYPGDALDLVGPPVDARAITNQLGARGVRVETLMDQGATAESLTTRLAALSESVGPDGAVVFVFAGHVVQQNGESLLIPGDADPSDPLARPLTLEAVLAAMDGPKHGLVVLDEGLEREDGQRFAPAVASTRYPTRQILSLEAGVLATETFEAGSPFIAGFVSALYGPSARSASAVAAATDRAQLRQVGRGGDFVFPGPRVDDPPDSALDAATDLRIRAQDSGEPRDFLAAADAYERYLGRYPYASNAWEVQWLLADSSRQGGELSRALEVYERLIRTGRRDAHPYLASSLVYRLQIWNQRVAEAGLTDARTADAAVERRNQAAPRPYDVYVVGPVAEGFIDAADAVLQHPFGEPRNETVDFRPFVEDSRAALLYIPGQILYHHNRFDEARPRLRSVIEQAPQSQEAQYAAGLLHDSYLKEGDQEGVARMRAEYDALLSGDELPELEVDLVELGNDGSVVGLAHEGVVPRGTSLALEVTIPQPMYVAAFYLDEVLRDGSRRLDEGRHRISVQLPDHAGDERFWVVASPTADGLDGYPEALPAGRIAGVRTVKDPDVFVGTHRQRVLQGDRPTVVDFRIQSAVVPEFTAEIRGTGNTLKGVIRNGQKVPPGAPMEVRIRSDDDAFYKVFLDGVAVENGETTVSAGSSGTLSVIPPVLPGSIQVVIVGSSLDGRVSGIPEGAEDAVGRTRTVRDALIPFHTRSASIAAFEVERSISAMLPPEDPSSGAVGDVTLPNGFQPGAPVPSLEPPQVQETASDAPGPGPIWRDNAGRVSQQGVLDPAIDKVVPIQYAYGAHGVSSAESDTETFRVEYHADGRVRLVSWLKPTEQGLVGSTRYLRLYYVPSSSKPVALRVDNVGQVRVRSSKTGSVLVADRDADALPAVEAEVERIRALLGPAGLDLGLQ